MRRFEYVEPHTLQEAAQLLNGSAGRASLLAGGTDLLVEIKEHLRWPAQVINLKCIGGLDTLSYDDAAGLKIGALVTSRRVETSPLVLQHYAGLAQAARELGSIQVRNRATVVGNLCRASPSADTAPPLIADEARIRLFGLAGERDLPLQQFFTGPGKTVLGPDEIVMGLTLPPPAPQTGKVYLKHGRRKAMELATVGVAVSLTLDGGVCRQVHIVLGAVAPTPIRAYAAEAALTGQPVDEGAIQAAAEAARQECRPISDVRSSADYRRAMVGTLTARALRLARDQALRPAA
jgi:aerobic carbon-monoxide dehydrogenase medium subunit